MSRPTDTSDIDEFVEQMMPEPRHGFFAKRAKEGLKAMLAQLQAEGENPSRPVEEKRPAKPKMRKRKSIK